MCCIVCRTSHPQQPRGTSAAGGGAGGGAGEAGGMRLVASTSAGEGFKVDVKIVKSNARLSAQCKLWRCSGH